MKIGLKLWSTNENYWDEAQRLVKEKVCDFIELYLVPTSTGLDLSKWKEIKVKYGIHAPHASHGMNPAVKELRDKNQKMMEQAQMAANELNADYIVVHPGENGKVDESIRQLKLFKDHRLAVENLPHKLIGGGGYNVGASVADMKKLIAETGLNFCLDIGHGICAANTFGIEPIKYLQQFLLLSPRVIHLSDGEFKNEEDYHARLGKGDYPLKQIMQLLNEDTWLLLETNKDYNDSLRDFEEDVAKLKDWI